MFISRLNIKTVQWLHMAVGLGRGKAASPPPETDWISVWMVGFVKIQ